MKPIHQTMKKLTITLVMNKQIISFQMDIFLQKDIAMIENDYGKTEWISIYEIMFDVYF